MTTTTSNDHDFYCDFIDAVTDLGFGPADFDTEGILPTWVENRYDAVNLTRDGHVVGLVIADTEAGAVDAYHMTNNGLIIDQVSLSGESVLRLVAAIWQAWK